MLANRLLGNNKMENTNKVERIKLWNDIYRIVNQIPRKEVDGDAVDAPSATTSIEKLFKTLLKE